MASPFPYWCISVSFRSPYRNWPTNCARKSIQSHDEVLVYPTAPPLPVTQLGIRSPGKRPVKGKPALAGLQITHRKDRVKAGHRCPATSKSSPFLQISHLVEVICCTTSGGLLASSFLYTLCLLNAKLASESGLFLHLSKVICFQSSSAPIPFLESSASNSDFSLLDLFQRLSPSLFFLLWVIPMHTFLFLLMTMEQTTEQESYGHD